MIWSAKLIWVVNLVQASLPSLADIISRTRLCLGENAHCPINIYKNVDLCCRPLVCTVIPKTCKPNFINKYFNISDYKDYRCMLPPRLLSLTESINQIVTLEPIDTTTVKYEFLTTTNYEFTVSDYNNDANYTSESNSSNTDTSDESTYNKTISTVLNESDSSNVVEYKSGSEEENSDKSSSNESFKGSLLDSQSYFDSNNEIKQLVKRYVSNDSNSDNSLSLSSSLLDGGNNLTLVKKLQFSNTSERYSDSASISESGEIYDYENNGSKTEESNSQNYSKDSIHRMSEELASPNFTNRSVLAETEEDWHSSDMKDDSRLKIYKIVTVQPLRWIETEAKAVKLNMSSEISE